MIFKHYARNKESNVYLDFRAWYYRHYHHEEINRSEFNAFFDLIHRFPEYRTLLYYRMPCMWGVIFKIILPPRKIYLCKNIGPGMLIEHGWSTIVSARSVGSNFMIHQNCTIGYNHGGCPTIGDNVKLYTGAVVVGPINIGNNVTIGANCVVLNDVPDDSLCYGNPCVVRKKQ